MRINNFKKNNIVKEEPKEIESLNWFDKKKYLMTFQLLLKATNLIARIKLLNLFNDLLDIILTDKTL